MGCIQEAFIGFENVKDQTGETLCANILKKLEDLRINTNGIVGQGYDGAANMSGIRKGKCKNLRVSAHQHKSLRI